MVNGIGFGKPRQPQSSNTGVKLTKHLIAGVDWLSATFHQEHFGAIANFTQALFKDNLVEQKHGMGFYGRSWRSPGGVVMASEPITGEGRTDAYLSIPGKTLDSLRLEEQQDLFKYLLAHGANFTRTDVKLDDFSKKLPLERVQDAVRAGNLAGFRAYRILESGKAGRSGGKTIELGRRGKHGTGKFLRIYDKSAESKGLTDSHRIEYEFSGERSQQVIETLAEAPIEFWGQLMAGWINGNVAFVDRTKSTRLDRCPKLDWWEEFTTEFDKIKLAVTRARPTLEKAMKWLQKQVAPTLATVLVAMRGTERWDEFLYSLLQDGESRLNDVHNSLINNFQLYTQPSTQ